MKRNDIERLEILKLIGIIICIVAFALVIGLTCFGCAIGGQVNLGLKASGTQDKSETTTTIPVSTTGTTNINLNKMKGDSNMENVAFWGKYGQIVQLSGFCLLQILVVAIFIILLCKFLPLYLPILKIIPKMWLSFIMAGVILLVRMVLGLFWEFPTGELICDSALGWGLNIVLYTGLVKKKLFKRD